MKIVLIRLYNLRRLFLEDRGQRTKDKGHLIVKDDFSPLRYGKSLIYRKAFIFA